MQAYRAALSQNAPKFLAKPRSFHSSAHRAATQSAIPHISLHIAASSSGKGRKFLNQNTLEFDPSEKVEQGVQKGRSIAERKRGRPDSGQDAFFIAKVGEEDEQLAFGIADGVGGWTSSGVDPADFAHGLCSYMAVSALRAEHVDTPRNLLQKGYNDVHQDRSIPAGGSTACIAIASTKGFVQIANLGDSGFLHLRRGAVHDLSSPQLHSFNTPYQLSVIPQHLIVQSAIFGGAPLSDQPSHADQFKQQLQHGDVLVLASDGVWDNLNAQDVLDIVCREMQKYGAWTETISEGIVVSEEAATLVKPGSVGGKHIASRTLQGVLAGAIAGEAKIASMNNKRDGPFAKEVQRYFPNENWHGGKVDDISVLVLISIQEQNPGDTELD
ncbi:putative 5-azacytidine resistance protein azr1 [Phaeomoniella chlamydospora]|uniref:Protein phosphatase n=1 Tax=Phaeomoniella chlamydospora TaxID=158046 RepID=A0A0G2EPS2_PHACM|nr:putative 5-azacytidine resistance protein azr1 [Phaeomoniella chlamydospora]